MQTCAAVASGLATRVDTIDGLRVDSVWPNAITPSHAIVLVKPSPRVTIGGDRTFDFLIKILLQISDMERAMTAMYLYMDPTGTKSIIAALEGDETLGGIANYVNTDDEGEGWDDFPRIEIIQTRDGPQNYIAADLKGSVWISA